MRKIHTAFILLAALSLTSILYTAPQTNAGETAQIQKGPADLKEIVTTKEKAAPALPQDKTQCTLSLQEIPDFVYRDDVRRFSIKLTRPFSFNHQNAKSDITISYELKGQKHQQTIKLANSKNSFASAILPFDFSDFPDQTALRLLASDTQTGQLFSVAEITVLNLTQAQKVSDKISLRKNGDYAYEKTRVIFMLPRPDETAQRRWKVIREIQKVPELFTPHLRILYSSDSQQAMLAPLEKKFKCELVKANGGIKDSFLQLLRNPPLKKTPDLLVIQSNYDLLHGTPATAYKQVIDAVAALASKYGESLYITPPPPFPANPGLQKHYSKATAEAASKRFSGYIEGFAQDTTFSGEYPKPEQFEAAGKQIVHSLYTGPRWQALLPIPLIIASIGFWWLRIYSRYRHKKGK